MRITQKTAGTEKSRRSHEKSKSSDGGGGHDGNDGYDFAVFLEFHRAFDDREEGVVASAEDILAGVEFRAALADEDFARFDELAAETLHTQSLAGAVAAVNTCFAASHKN